MVVTKWSPVIEKEKAPAQSIPMWVHLKNVPLNMFSWKGLSFVASPIGTPVRLHPETAQCLDMEVAKIFVKVDLTKDLPKKMNFNIQGPEFLIEYSYPWLPKKCPKCEKWGHYFKACPNNKVSQSEAQKEQETLEVRGEEKTMENQSIRVEENSSIQQGSENDHERTEKLNEVLVENVEEVLASVTEIKDERVLEQVVLLKDAVAIETGATTPVETETVEEKEWLDFSPGKSSRSPLRSK